MLAGARSSRSLTIEDQWYHVAPGCVAGPSVVTVRAVERRGHQNAARRTAEPHVPILLATAIEMGRLANEALARAGFDEGVLVGDVRRGVEIVDDLKMVVRGPHDVRALASALGNAEACTAVDITGKDQLRLVFQGGGRAHVHVVPRTRFVEAIVRETGSPRHVRWLESMAASSGGLGAVSGRARDEAGVYTALGLPFAPPELRERSTRRVPDLVGSVRGIFHVHTLWSDGTASIAEMARATRAAGFEYLGITEHSRAASYAGGLDASQLRRQAREVSHVRREVPDVLILHGVEVDVLADGSLDIDDAALAALDFVIASVHTDLDMAAPEMTARLLAAVRHPLVTILGHPTGRLLLGREGSAFDVEAVAAAAAENDTFLEINANPQRLDLGEDLVRRAAARGARFAIDPDAHTPRGVRDTGLGLTVARRAGLSASQVLNARGADEVKSYLAARRRKARRALALA